MHASSALSPADAMGSPVLPVKVRLVAGIGASWPEPVQALGAKWLNPDKLLKKLSEPKSWGCWLGYVSPIALLLEQQPNQASALEDLLDAWLEHTTIFLKARELAPERCRLINLSHLDAASLSLLLNDYSDIDSDADGDGEGDADSEGEDPASEQDPADTLPLLLQLYLQRRPDVLNRYADLEGQADLLGREPEFSLSLQRPDPGTWATLLLQAWQAHLQLPQAQEQVAELETQLAQANAAADELRQSSQQSSQHITNLETQLAAASTANSDQLQLGQAQLQEAQTQLSEAREEAELTLLQLHQVQEELEYQFLEHRKASQERDALQQQLASLRAEMGYYFLLSQADPCLEQGRIPQLKALMRETLIRR